MVEEIGRGDMERFREDENQMASRWIRERARERERARAREIDNVI